MKQIKNFLEGESPNLKCQWKDTFDSCFNGRLIRREFTGVNFKWRVD